MVYGGGLREPLKVVLYNAILYNTTYINDPDMLLKPLFGLPVVKSEIFPFSHTQYYVNEMGSSLSKYFAGYSFQIYPDEILRYKLITVDLERSFMVDGKRIINIDPGYVALEKVVAASTKNFSHRIYLGSNIYADLQLYRKKGVFRSLPWTFYDYKQPFVLNFFDELRNNLL